MQFKVSGEVGGYVSEAGGAHEVQGGAESIGVADIDVGEARRTVGGKSVLERILIRHKSNQVIVDKRCGYA